LHDASEYLPTTHVQQSSLQTCTTHIDHQGITNSRAHPEAPIDREDIPARDSYPTPPTGTKHSLVVADDFSGSFVKKPRIEHIPTPLRKGSTPSLQTQNSASSSSNHGPERRARAVEPHPHCISPPSSPHCKKHRTDPPDRVQTAPVHFDLTVDDSSSEDEYLLLPPKE
jgi:hypothetical protein